MPTARRAPPPDADDPRVNASAARVLRRFRIVFNTVRSHFREVEKTAGIAGAQLWALSVVAAQPGIGVSPLAKAMDIHQSTASNLVKPLLEQGLLLAERTGTDRRAVQLKVSAAGARLLRRAPGPFSGVLPDALSQLDPATLTRLERDLARLIDLLGVDRHAATVPLGQPDGDDAPAVPKPRRRRAASPAG